ncbi:MAG: carbon-nitrogen hydrolase family protein [Spirochaetales bacterium]|nr:carbon-nitrogen hydrolase family protein [Spirochaetales bacterium]
MIDVFPKYKAAVIHAAPVFMDKDKSVEKACGLIQEAAKKGASIAVFGEGFIPGYPLWSMVNPPYAIHELFLTLYRNACSIPGPEIDCIRSAAKKAGVFVSLGVNEKKKTSPGTLWAANLLIDPNGRIIAHHQKLVPTYAEKLVWSNGCSRGLSVSSTNLGSIGALICGENTNPLARFALLAQGEQIHLSSYPPAWPFKDVGAKDEYDPCRANEIRAAAHAFEGKVFNVVACSVCDELTIEKSALSDKARELIERTPKPASMVIGPAGNIISGPVTGDKEEILIADIDLEKSIIEKQAHDITGGYNRFDVFTLHLCRNPLDSLKITDGGTPEEPLDPSNEEPAGENIHASCESDMLREIR